MSQKKKNEMAKHRHKAGFKDAKDRAKDWVPIHHLLIQIIY